MPLSSSVRRGINLYDVVFVKLMDAKNKQAARAELRVRPMVQGAAIILDNKTGGILAMAGGFSYPLSQLNRTTQSQRQPGSSLKPFTYLAALQRGLQPNTLVRDQQITLPPINGSYNARDRDYWTPKNADGGGGGITTLRRGLENSKNLVTANLLDGGIDGDPSQSLARICDLTIDAQIYSTCVAYYPFVLGAQPAHLIDMAAFYVANEGRRPAPYGIESIEQDGRAVYTHEPEFKWLASGDRPAFFSSRPCCRAWWRAEQRERSRRCRPMSPARPAPATTRMMPGSSASPMTSRSACGSAMTEHQHRCCHADPIAQG
jgi:membrane carboxypeptidase/penicillin-binding protein